MAIETRQDLIDVLVQLRDDIETSYPRLDPLMDWQVCKRFNQIISVGEEIEVPGLLPEQIEENDQPSISGMLTLIKQTVRSLGGETRGRPVLIG